MALILIIFVFCRGKVKNFFIKKKIFKKKTKKGKKENATNWKCRHPTRSIFIGAKIGRGIACRAHAYIDPKK